MGKRRLGGLVPHDGHRVVLGVGEEDLRAVVVHVHNVDGDGGGGGHPWRALVAHMHLQLVAVLQLPVDHHVAGGSDLTVRVDCERRQGADGLHVVLHLRVDAHVPVVSRQPAHVPLRLAAFHDVELRRLQCRRVVVHVQDLNDDGRRPRHRLVALVDGLDDDGDFRVDFPVEDHVGGQHTRLGVQLEHLVLLGVQVVVEPAVDALVEVVGRHPNHLHVLLGILRQVGHVHVLREHGRVVVDVAHDDAEHRHSRHGRSSRVRAGDGDVELLLRLAVQLLLQEHHETAAWIQLLNPEARVVGLAVDRSADPGVVVLYLQRAHEAGDLFVLRDQHGAVVQRVLGQELGAGRVVAGVHNDHLQHGLRLLHGEAVVLRLDDGVEGVAGDELQRRDDLDLARVGVDGEELVELVPGGWRAEGVGDPGVHAGVQVRGEDAADDRSHRRVLHHAVRVGPLAELRGVVVHVRHVDVDVEGARQGLQSTVTSRHAHQVSVTLFAVQHGVDVQGHLERVVQVLLHVEVEGAGGGEQVVAHHGVPLRVLVDGDGQRVGHPGVVSFGNVESDLLAGERRHVVVHVGDVDGHADDAQEGRDLGVDGDVELEQALLLVLAHRLPVDHGAGEDAPGLPVKSEERGGLEVGGVQELEAQGLELGWGDLVVDLAGAPDVPHHHSGPLLLHEWPECHVSHLTSDLPQTEQEKRGEEGREGRRLHAEGTRQGRRRRNADGLGSMNVRSVLRDVSFQGFHSRKSCRTCANPLFFRAERVQSVISEV